MPEGPIIRLLAEEAEPFVGKEVVKAYALTDELGLDRFCGQKIKEIKVFGKQLLIRFDDFSVRIHLMLFGYYLINSHSVNGKLRLGLKFKQGELNFYAADIRIIEQPLDELYDWRADVMNPEFDAKLAIEKLNALGEKVLICDALLDQNIFAGVGNMIKNDTLFKAEVHPMSKAVNVPDKKKLELAKEAVKVSFDFLEWKRTDSQDEKFVAHFRTICPRDKVPMKKKKMGRNDRAAYFCEICQKKY